MYQTKDRLYLQLNNALSTANVTLEETSAHNAQLTGSLEAVRKESEDLFNERQRLCALIPAILPVDDQLTFVFDRSCLGTRTWLACKKTLKALSLD